MSLLASEILDKWIETENEEVLEVGRSNKRVVEDEAVEQALAREVEQSLPL